MASQRDSSSVPLVMPHIEFGVFDHLDRRPDTPLGQTYEDRLKLVEGYDRAGFHAHQIAEHHATPLTVAPAPSVFGPA